MILVVMAAIQDRTVTRYYGASSGSNWLTPAKNL